MAADPTAALCELILANDLYLGLKYDAAGRFVVSPWGCSECDVQAWRRVVVAAEDALGIEVRHGQFCIDANVLPAALCASLEKKARKTTNPEKEPPLAKNVSKGKGTFHEAAGKRTWKEAAELLWRKEPKFMFQCAMDAESNFKRRRCATENGIV